MPLLRSRGHTEWRGALLLEGGPHPTDPAGSPHRATEIRTARYKYVESRSGVKELYDLVRDPYELTNVAHDPVYREIVESLGAALASPLVVYERPGPSSVAGSLLLDEASETASAGPQGPRRLTTASSSSC